MKLFAVSTAVVCCLAVCGCKPKYRQQDQPINSHAPDQESVYQANQKMIRQDAEAIRDQALRKGWNLTETGTGIFYQVFGPKGKKLSKKIAPGDRVFLTYDLRLLDGTECYSSKNLGLKQFVVEKSEAEPGLHEVIQFLHPGDSALIILPPHRAFGLVGDGNRIPPRAILVYEIRIDSVARYETN